jgi:hypothetical protein
MPKTFTSEFDVPIGGDAVLGRVMREFVPFFGRYKYQVTDQGPAGLTLTRRYLSGWAFLGGLLTFPLGILIWALVRVTETVTVTFTALGPSSTRVLVTGQGPPEVREYAAALEHQAAKAVDPC